MIYLIQDSGHDHTGTYAVVEGPDGMDIKALLAEFNELTGCRIVEYTETASHAYRQSTYSDEIAAETKKALRVRVKERFRAVKKAAAMMLENGWMAPRYIHSRRGRRELYIGSYLQAFASWLSETKGFRNFPFKTAGTWHGDVN